ncbi:MAG: hypothetical protein ABIJ38_02450, partial [Patescibacteria group bacterium]
EKSYFRRKKTRKTKLTITEIEYDSPSDQTPNLKPKTKVRLKIIPVTREITLAFKGVFVSSKA